MSPPQEIDRVGRDAAILSAVEIGLGSFLHALHVPFRGHFLSLNETFWLTRTLRREGRAGNPRARLLPLTVANVAAVLKSLSPAGKKLTPMLAISAQGFCFGAGTLVLGANAAGAMLGAVFSGLWAFAQPLALAYLIFGETLLKAGDYFLEKSRESFAISQEHIWIFVGALVAVKTLLEIVAVILAYRLPESRVESYQNSMASWVRPAKEQNSSSKFRGALRDLCHPLFLAAFAFSSLFFVFSEHDKGKLAWLIMRPIAVGFLFFYVLRIVPWNRVLARLERSRFKDFSRALKTASESLPTSQK